MIMISIVLLIFGMIHPSEYTLNECYLLYSQNNFRATVNGCTALIVKDPKCEECYFLRGLAQKHMGDLKSAEQDFLYVIDVCKIKANDFIIDSTYYYSFRYLGEIYTKMGKDSLALSNYKNYLKYNERDPYVNVAVGSLYAKGGNLDSVSYYAFTAYRNDSLNFDIVYLCGQLAINSELYIEAAFYYNEALNISIDYRPYLGLAIISLIHGEKDIANYNFNKVFELTNNDGNAYYYHSLLKLSERDTISFCKDMDRAKHLGVTKYTKEHYKICDHN